MQGKIIHTVNGPNTSELEDHIKKNVPYIWMIQACYSIVLIYSLLTTIYWTDTSCIKALFGLKEGHFLRYGLTALLIWHNAWL